MSKLRYKNHPEHVFNASQFNTHALAEVLTGDDSAFIKDLDVFIEALGDWKDMSKAFKDKDLINNNYNTHFFEPTTEEDRKRGYTLT